jgi:group I intron endonuclease
MDYKVYKYTNKLNSKVYVGQTRQTLKRRAGSNAYNYLKEKNSRFSKAIAKYGWSNFVPEILFNNLSKDEADLKEMELIRKYDSYNPEKGYNGTLGGASFISTIETRKKISEGVKNSKLFRDKNFKAHAKKVVSINIASGKFETYNSLTDAQSTTEVLRTNIARCYNGKLQSAGGFIWVLEENFKKEKIGKYLSDFEKRKSRRYGRIRNKKVSNSQRERLSEPGATDYLKKKVVGKNLATGQELRFNSIKEACDYTGIKAPSNIALVCANKRLSAGGFSWKYDDK